MSLAALKPLVSAFAILVSIVHDAIVVVVLTVAFVTVPRVLDMHARGVEGEQIAWLTRSQISYALVVGIALGTAAGIAAKAWLHHRRRPITVREVNVVVRIPLSMVLALLMFGSQPFWVPAMVLLVYPLSGLALAYVLPRPMWTWGSGRDE